MVRLHGWLDGLGWFDGYGQFNGAQRLHEPVLPYPGQGGAELGKMSFTIEFVYEN